MQNEFSWNAQNNERIQGYSWRTQPKAKAALIIIHGLGEHSLRYRHVADFFNKNQMAVYSFDIIGHGKSGGKRGHVDSYDSIVFEIMHLISVAKAENPNVPVFLYGHSLGGALVLYTALKNNPDVAGYIVTSPGLIPADPPKGFKLLLAKVMDKIGPSFTLDNGLYRPGLSRDPKVVEAYNNDPLVHPMISARLGMQFLKNGEWMIAHASELSKPTLLMQGTLDKLVDPKGAKQFVSNAPKSTITYKEWADHFHELHNEPDKEDVLKFILNWLKSVNN